MMRGRSLGRWRTAFLLCAAFLSVPHTTSAQSTVPPGRAADVTVSGNVRDSAGGAVPRATIVLRQESAGLDLVSEGRADGSFAVSRLAFGRYLLTVSAPGFSPVTQTVVVPAAAPVVVTLSPAPIVE